MNFTKLDMYIDIVEFFTALGLLIGKFHKFLYARLKNGTYYVTGYGVPP